ncbi:MAG: HlyD family efflux transporter periplasmic adaptor subunit [Gammaproteobacteria bacterium]|nr:HlyD family efflux transporter periplasmic adaptor subunit [Gammaproteobacteria bacterium]
MPNPTIPHRKTILLGLAAGLVIAALIWSMQPQPVPVALASAERAPLAVTLTEEGRTRVQNRYLISAPVAAFAPRIQLQEGDAVSAGQELLRLQPMPSAVLDARSRAESEARVERARAALLAAQSEHEAAAASHELAQQEWQRLQPLFAQGTISRSMLDRANADLRRSAAELRSASHAVEIARQDLRQAEAVIALDTPLTQGEQTIPVVAPVNGRVLQVHHQSAGIVQLADPLLCVADPASLEVVVEVLSDDAVRLQPGMPVQLHRWGGAEPLAGVVSVVEPGGFTKVSALGVEEQRVRVIVDIVSPYALWQGLGDAYRVAATFVLWQQDDVLQVPNGAVFRHADGWAVFRVEQQRARLRPVEIGRRGEQQVQITAGVESGDVVINHPDREIADGTLVKPFEQLALD